MLKRSSTALSSSQLKRTYSEPFPRLSAKRWNSSRSMTPFLYHSPVSTLFPVHVGKMLDCKMKHDKRRENRVLFSTILRPQFCARTLHFMKLHRSRELSITLTFDTSQQPPTDKTELEGKKEYGGGIDGMMPLENAVI